MRSPRQLTTVTQQLPPQGGRLRWRQQQLLPCLSQSPPWLARPDAIPQPLRKHHHWPLEVAAAAAAGAQRLSGNPGQGR